MEYQGGALEAIVVRILRRELAVAKRLDAAGPVAPITAPRAPCQLYVHMPFCESLCPFCSFHRVEYREDKSRSYFKSVRRELRLYRYRGFQFRDVSIGGGTPTVNPGELLKTIRLIRSFWDIRSLSVETHPNDLTPHVLDGLQSARVDRLSVGVQSFDDVLCAPWGASTRTRALRPSSDGGVCTWQALRSALSTSSSDMGSERL
jgi:coproporphyrinogen III oxidase-like Fe-S oxidoreductase